MDPLGDLSLSPALRTGSCHEVGTLVAAWWRREAGVGGPRHQIALIEDTDADVFLVREALEQAGLEFDLLVLQDGEKAINFIAAIETGQADSCPQLIILDLNLPIMSGKKILERVRQT